ncbi:DUF2326 domain-containing protein [Streptococcus pneumoniae]|uniref:DUF2326 domain-containing protein n=2 Tax=Streptococcus pneumoniae TaxID=1313 RepID=UPI0005DAD32E|nr:DUF2326 domain-containing protein [Streptococcus pneumoniae]CIS58893.1 Uncharacterised protein [Streptococcus pneumoniae]CIV28227.1 Uncharacterised protein [Streptococcus pneumoniae]CIV75310.1 Uncharacterised protein [Streptococcus pneumoniae]CIX10527.1 Uncharacterised protein [Streptococcus pneumoniae]COD43145.1 Uncharacterised protein [Streptococcus pneumoniae]
MFIKCLSIISKNTDVVLRKIEFKNGINFIVDSEKSDKHNKVGKTTCLKLLDLSLGAKSKDVIFKDYETQSVNEQLRLFIENQKIYTDMVLIDDFNHPSKEVSIKTELFNRGKRYINGEQTSYDEVNKYLNRLLFENRSQKPSFRSAIKSFVRILMTKDNTQFLKVLDNFSNISEYRAVYNYLFDISDPENDLEFGKLKQELKNIKSKENNYKKVNTVDDVVKIKQINVAIEKEIDRLEKEINDLVDKKAFEKNRIHINDIRKKYEEISRQLSKIDFDILQLQKYIKEAEEKSQRIVNQELANDFFQEISELLPSITKTFLDLVEFNSQLSRNKLSYFNDRMQELIMEKEDKENLLTKLTEENSKFISLVEENKVDLYYDKLNQLDELKIKKVKNESTITSLGNIEEQKNTLEKRLSKLEMIVKNNEAKYQKKMDIFNSYFKSVAGRINKEQPVLLYNPKTDEFPVSIGQLSEGTSTGTRKSLIAAYDIAYQLFAREINKATPKFIVHDVLESIEGDDIRALVDEVESNQIQYISAILKEKLVSSGMSLEEQNKMIILELSLKDRLFERGNNC